MKFIREIKKLDWKDYDVRDGLNSFNGAVRFVRKRGEGGRESAKG